MSFTFAPDFVITKRRKRTRQAVDPCLGFYPEASCSPAHVVRTTSLAPPNRADTSKPLQRDVDADVSQAEVPCIQLCASLDIHPETGVTGASVEEVALGPDACLASHDGATDDTRALTVEEFLRHAASPTKRYGHRRSRKRKRALRVQPDSQDSYRPSSASDPIGSDEDASSSPEPSRKRRRSEVRWTSDEAEDVRSPPKERAKRRPRPLKKVQSLAARLLLAGAATGIEVAGGPLDPAFEAHTSTRRPIRFVPNHRLPSPVPDSRVLRRHYVDPRKAPLLRKVSQFAAANDEPPISRKHARPITGWKPYGHEVSSRGDDTRRRLACTNAERFVTVPLVFAHVSQDGNMRVDMSTRGRKLAPSTKCHPQPPASSQEAIPFGPFVIPSPKRPMPPSAIGLRPCAAIFVAKSSAPGSPRGPANDTEEDLTSPPPCSSPPPEICASAALSAQCATNPAPLQTAAMVNNAEFQITPGVPSEEKSLHVYVSPETIAPLTGHPIDDTNLSIDAAVCAEATITPSLHARPMKSLGTLLDGFREIARSATQVSMGRDPMHGRRSRPRTSQAILTRSGVLAHPLATNTALSKGPHAGASSATPSASSTRPSLSLRRLRDRVNRAKTSILGCDNPATPIDAIDPTSSDTSEAVPLKPSDSAQGDSIDVLFILRNRRRNVLHLPSSPLPGWSALPPGTSNTNAEHASSDSVRD